MYKFSEYLRAGVAPASFAPLLADTIDTLSVILMETITTFVAAFPWAVWEKKRCSITPPSLRSCEIPLAATSLASD